MSEIINTSILRDKNGLGISMIDQTARDAAAVNAEEIVKLTEEIDENTTMPAFENQTGAIVTASTVADLDLCAVTNIDYTADGVTSVHVNQSNCMNFCPKLKKGTYEQFGITMVVDDDGVVTLNGTCTRDTISVIIPFETSFYFSKKFILHTIASSAQSTIAPSFIKQEVDDGYFAVPDPAYRVYVPSGSFLEKVVGNEISGMTFYVPTNTVLKNWTYKAMLRLDETKTDYEPADAKSYSVDLGQTVHGGTFNWSSGKLTVTHNTSGQLASPIETTLTEKRVVANDGQNILFSESGNMTISGERVSIVPIVMALRESVSTLEKQVGGDPDVIPSYWAEYLEGRKAEIRSGIVENGTDSVAFAYFTDNHIGTGTAEYASTKSRFIIDWLRENTTIRKVIFGGDILNTPNTQTREQAVSWLWKFHDYYIAERNVLPVVGNHEISTQFNTNGDIATKEETYNIIFRRVEEIADTQGGFYYYVDNESQKVRYIILDSESVAFSENTAQMAWFINLLKEMESGWTAVLFAHGSNLQAITDIGGDYNNRSSGSQGDVTWDFSDASGSVACLICGHEHKDYSETVNGLLVIHVTTDAGASSSNVAVDPDAAGKRNEGDVTEQAMDVFFINTDARTIKTIRLGYGENREWTY